MTTTTATEEPEPAIAAQVQAPTLVRTWPFYLVWIDPTTGDLVQQQWQPVENSRYLSAVPQEREAVTSND